MAFPYCFTRHDFTLKRARLRQKRQLFKKLLLQSSIVSPVRPEILVARIGTFQSNLIIHELSIINIISPISKVEDSLPVIIGIRIQLIDRQRKICCKRR